MRIPLLLLLGVSPALLVAAPPISATVTGKAQTRIYTPITLLASRALDFGDVFPGTEAGTITLDAGSSMWTLSGAGVSLGVHTPIPSFFVVGGKKNASYTLTLPGAILLTGGSGPAISVDTFTASVNGGVATSNPTGLALDANGVMGIQVGATMHIAAAQGEGDYNGTYDLTVAYN